MAALYLFDTNILVHFVREDSVWESIKLKYQPFMTEPLPLFCVVSEGELKSLAYRWQWGANKRERMRFLLNYFGRVSLDIDKLIEAYALIDSYSESIGHSMGKNDVWIAAAAYHTAAILLTTDADFDHLHPHLINRDWINPNLEQS